MALTNPCFKDQNWSHLGRGNRGEEKEKRRREEEEKKRSQDQANKVWKLPLVMDYMRLCMNCHAWLVSSLSPNLGFC